MKPDELLDAIGDVKESYIYAAGECRKGRKNILGKRTRLLLVAAIVILSVLLMGSAVIIRLTLATAPEYPLVSADNISPEDIHLTVSNVTPTSMQVYCSISGVEEGVNDIFMQISGPFILEKQTEDGWEALPVKLKDPTWDADDIRTHGSTEWSVDWSAHYGILESGIYRYTATILEGNEPVSVEFVIEEEEKKDLRTLIENILVQEYYHIQYTSFNEFGAMDKLSRDDRNLIESEYENVVWIDEYWKHGDNMLNISYRNSHPWTGMMYRDGIKFQLDHEGDDRSNPVRGWSPWPDGDMRWLTLWTELINADTSTLQIEYREDGSLARVTRSVYSPRFHDTYEVEVTHKEEWVFFQDDPVEISEEIEGRDTDTALPFSWAEDTGKMKSLDVTYRNTTAEPVATATEAIKRAMAECSVEYDKILVYRDESAGMWKVEFQIEYGYQGYQYIYLNDEGITQMVSALGSKVPEWKDRYPDP